MCGSGGCLIKSLSFQAISVRVRTYRFLGDPILTMKLHTFFHDPLLFILSIENLSDSQRLYAKTGEQNVFSEIHTTNLAIRNLLLNIAASTVTDTCTQNDLRNPCTQKLLTIQAFIHLTQHFVTARTITNTKINYNLIKYHADPTIQISHHSSSHWTFTNLNIQLLKRAITNHNKQQNLIDYLTSRSTINCNIILYGP